MVRWTYAWAAEPPWVPASTPSIGEGLLNLTDEHGTRRLESELGRAYEDLQAPSSRGKNCWPETFEAPRSRGGSSRPPLS